MLEVKDVDNTVDNPVEDVMDLFPTDHDIEEVEATDEIAEDETIEDQTTEEVEDEESEDESNDESEEEVEETDLVAYEDLEIKVLGETKLLKDIPREELQSKVRMGEDYPRVKESLNVARDELNEWKEISEMFELSPQEVREALKNQHFTKTAESEGRSVDDVRKEYTANKKSIQDKMYERFLDKYPDVKTDELPTVVIDEVKLGKDLTKVYDDYIKDTTLSKKDDVISELEKKIADLESKVNVKTQNTKSKKKGVVKKTSGSDSNTTTDDFLMGLSGEY